MLPIDNSKHIEYSVIIPAYNSEKFINSTIKSISSFLSNYKYEILVIDDGSDDDTVKMVKSLGLANLKIYTNKHKGVSYSRNLGINEANGKYIMFCDSDDKLIGKLPFQKFEEEIISFSAYCKKENIVKTQEDKLFLIENLFGFGKNKDNFSGYYGGSVSKFFKREWLIQNSIYFNTELDNSEDILFNLHAILNATKIKLLKKEIYQYYQRSTSVTHSYDEKLLDNHIVFISEIKKELTKFHDTADLIQRIESLYLYQLIFRLFKNDINFKSDYQKYCLMTNHPVNSNWNTNLTRQVECFSIKLVNNFGINVARHFASFYITGKKIIRHNPNKKVLYI
ncbi:glycosyltransferase family 2 protein [Limosilactobacillus reuteri]|uniref:glycosyltransferase family 2 protein n=1 Tax=Limosilactobacillus reuteri TaxID=1598 RepID=UPI001E65DADB|nr:glycosyltransferase family 2 protein [Limosilactobacillus reuteri]MCC4516218.1 glycosyltransferase [Limosilactobacillus reuteri]MDL2058150.1 glycosyltransferase family 2 protein [Limosilactobacillus reuteri]